MIGKHYDYSYRGIKIDPYRIFTTYGIAHPAQQHAIKKLLRAGQSVKTLRQDIDEAIVTLERWKAMLDEDDADKANAPQSRSFAVGGQCRHRRRKTEINRDGGPSFVVCLECGFEAEIQRDATLGPFKPAY